MSCETLWSIWLLFSVFNVAVIANDKEILEVNLETQVTICLVFLVLGPLLSVFAVWVLAETIHDAWLVNSEDDNNCHCKK